MLDITQHDTHAAADYARLAQFGIETARESAGWRLTEEQGKYDLAPVIERSKAAQKLGVQLLWSLMHYGWPADIDIFSPAVVERFARFCGAVAQAITPYAHDAPRIYTPINEVSFLTWAITQTGLMHPYRGELGVVHRPPCNSYAHALWQAQNTVTRGLADAARITTQGPRMSPLLVFSHLRWDFVYQRPQHLMTRLAQSAPVLFVEEPVFDERPPFVEMLSPYPNVRVARPHTPIAAAGFHDEQLPAMRALLRDVLEREGFTEYAVWFYTPMALPLLQDLAAAGDRLRLHGRAVGVPQCAPAAAAARERAAEGGRRGVHRRAEPVSRQARSLHANVHCFPSSVDAAHFAQARDRSNAHPHSARTAAPRLGFFGVIDERFDPSSIAAAGGGASRVADRAGRPGVKIDPAQLAAARRTSTTSASSPTRTCRGSSPAGTCACCRSRSTSRRASSARPRRSSTWRPKPDRQHADRPTSSTLYGDMRAASRRLLASLRRPRANARWPRTMRRGASATRCMREVTSQRPRGTRRRERCVR